MKSNKFPRVAFGPWRQTHIAQDLAVLLGAEFKFVVIREEFWQVEELGNQLFHVRHVDLRRRQPCVLHRVEQAVREVEIPLGRG